LGGFVLRGAAGGERRVEIAKIAQGAREAQQRCEVVRLQFDHRAVGLDGGLELAAPRQQVGQGEAGLRVIRPGLHHLSHQAERCFGLSDLEVQQAVEVKRGRLTRVGLQGAPIERGRLFVTPSLMVLKRFAEKGVGVDHRMSLGSIAVHG